MNEFIDLVVLYGNRVSIVVVLLLILGFYVWAIQTEKLFSGPRGRQLLETIKTQTKALEIAQQELREVELDYERLRVLYEVTGGEILPERRRRGRTRER